MARTLLALAATAVFGAVAIVGVPAQAQDRTIEAIQKYRETLLDANPAELLVMRGEDLWKTKRGPKNASLQQCDLGLGAGVVKGAYAQMPRYFADADRVMDFEDRLVHCMVTLQGMEEAELTKKPFSGTGQRQTDLEALTAYVVEQSRGMKIAVPQNHPKEKASYERGKYLFYMRAGPYDFACSTCHGVEGQRIRLQDLPNFENKQAAEKAFAQWPAYRVSQGAMRTMQWRIYDCFRQQRFPELKYTSQASIDLITYLGVTANGGAMEAPAIKR